jgi:hypothetical protein
LSGVVATIALTLACIGAGGGLLKLSKLDAEMTLSERLIWGFGIGIVVIGWIVFSMAVIGWISQAHLIGLVAVALLGLVSFRNVKFATISFPSRDIVWLALFGATILTFSFDVFEAFSPPIDADSLAYHFAMVKQFIGAGQLEFVPRAVDGAVPLMLHMTYLVAYGLGGELGLTTWCLITGWATGLMIWVIAKRHLPDVWSWVLVILFMTTPAVIYGAGTGQVETRLALFALASAYAIGLAIVKGDIRYALLAGVFAGAFIGSKYTGLLFATAGAAAFVWAWRQPRMVLVYCLGCGAIGWQWYWWNWINTGDPMFPVLFETLKDFGYQYWGIAQNVAFSEYYAKERGVVPSLWGLIKYPFVATLFEISAFESTRTGFGPLALLLLPFALIGGWLQRRRIVTSPLFGVAIVAFGFYVLMFFIVPSHRVRHLLPIYPLLLISFMVLAYWGAKFFHANSILVSAVVITLGIQLVGHGVAVTPMVKYALTNETTDGYLGRYLLGYPVVRMINDKLAPGAKVMITNRQIIYYLDTKHFLAHPVHQGVINIRSDASDTRAFLAKIRQVGITHIQVQHISKSPNSRMSSMEVMTSELVARGCAQVKLKTSFKKIVSRIGHMLGSSFDLSETMIVELLPGPCEL